MNGTTKKSNNNRVDELGRIKVVVINNNSSVTLHGENIGFILYAPTNTACCLDVVSFSGGGYLFSAIGSKSGNIIYEYLSYRYVKITNKVGWPIRFVILD